MGNITNKEKQAEERWREAHNEEERTAQLRAVSEALQREIAGRMRVEEALRKLNAELEQRVAARTRELTALYEVTAVTSGEALHLETTLERLLTAIGSQAGAIHLPDEPAQTLHLAAQQALPPAVAAQLDRLPVGSGLAGWVLEHGEPLVVHDLATDPRAPQSVRAAGLHTYVGVPMRAGGRGVGVLSAFGEAGYPFTVEGIALLASIADHVGVAVENARLYDQVQRRMRELGALYLADEELYRHLDLGQVLQALVDVAVDLGGADKSSVLMWDDQQKKLVARVARNLGPETVARLSVALGEGIAGQVAVSGEPMVVEDTRTHPYGTMRDLMESEGICVSMHIPIEIGDPVHGVFNVDYTRPRVLDREDQRLFLALAQRAALAIRNARLHAQAQQAAMLEERQRLARELHDSVTQSLYSLTLLTEAGRQLAEVGEIEGVKHHLIRIGESAQQALKEMRLLIYESRLLALKREGLLEALHQRLDAVERRAGVRAHLVVETPVELPLAVEEELYQIVQEALNNALKHASATSVTIYIRTKGEQVELEVVDNGRGFDPDAVSDQGGVGLSTMRERAQHLGGFVEIRSRPGEGTRVRVVIRGQ